MSVERVFITHITLFPFLWNSPKTPIHIFCNTRMESDTPTHEIETTTDDNLSWGFVRDNSDSVSSNQFNGTWVMICFFGLISIIVGGVIYFGCRSLKEENTQETEMDHEQILARGDLISMRRNALYDTTKRDKISHI